VAQRLKCLLAMRETWVRSLGREDPLEKAMAPHSSILAWRIPWTEEPGGMLFAWSNFPVVLVPTFLKRIKNKADSLGNQEKC